MGKAMEVNDLVSGIEHIKAVEKIVHNLRRELSELTGKVKKLSDENRELKTWARAIAAKIRSGDEDDEDDRVWTKMADRRAECSPKPANDSPE